ncbi:sensor histidine kinase [Couchioplanes azureus]|uniref:sensor histidine kinase n=1 Tax=Couchioplanes caeruleus TaxID=56438 RepID=UPI00166FDB3E|nr:histidine kinase [Couchioplanes caeruleus]
MGWVGRLFDARDTFVRMLLLDLSGVGYLVFGTEAGRSPTRTQWVLALLAFATALALHRRRVANLLVQSALLIAANLLVRDQMINEVGTSWALLELTMATPRPRVYAAGATLVAAIHLVAGYAHDPDRWGTPVFGALVVVGLPVLLGLVIRTTRELGRQAEAKAEAERQRRESESRAARADERSAIARELHDVVAHHVASMVLRVGVARHVLPDADPRVTDVFDDVHRTGAAALADLRRLVAVLRDPTVRTDAALTAIEPAALPAALAAAVSTARQAGLTVDCTIDEEAASIDAVRGMAVLRLTQEALTNVAKHAGPAAHARLVVRVENGDVLWSVADDGGGVVPALPSGGGHGLTGMRERVEVLGGRLTAGPAAGGWRVSTTLPAVPAAPAASPVPDVTTPPAGAGLPPEVIA